MSEPFKNLKQLADYLELSPATVSRVLNGKSDSGRISKDTQQRVLEAVQKRGLIRNAVARGLKTSKTLSIGLLVPDIRNPFFAAVAQSIVKFSRDCGYSVMLCDNEEDESIEKNQLSLLVERQVDGIIAAPVGAKPLHWHDLKKRGIPLCLVDRYFVDHNIPYVSSNNRQGAKLAIGHLVEKGHRNIAIIQGNPETVVNRERLIGCEMAFKEAGILMKEEWKLGSDFGEANGYRCAMSIFQNAGNRPTAIFAFSNMIAMGVMRAAAENSVGIPDDLSLIAFDEQRHSRFLNPPLSTIAQDVQKIGKEAVEQLIKCMDNQAFEEGILIETQLVERESVREVQEIS